MGSPFLELFLGYGVNVKVKSKVKGQIYLKSGKNHLYGRIICGLLLTYSRMSVFSGLGR